MTAMEKRNAKIAKAMEEEFDLNGYEVRNVIKVANRRNKIMTATIESWYTNSVVDQFGFITVECHMMDLLNDKRLDDVIINCYMYDRRRSFCSKTVDEIK